MRLWFDGWIIIEYKNTIIHIILNEVINGNVKKVHRDICMNLDGTWSNLLHHMIKSRDQLSLCPGELFNLMFISVEIILRINLMDVKKQRLYRTQSVCFLLMEVAFKHNIYEFLPDNLYLFWTRKDNKNRLILTF